MGVTRRQWFFRGIIVVMVLTIIVRQYVKYRIAPELELHTLQLADMEGLPIDLTDYKGQNILLTYYATWCGPCHAEIAFMEAARPQLEDEDFVLIHVSDEEVDKINGFIAKNPSGITFLQSLTPLADIGVHTFPTHFLFDKAGALRFKQTDPLDWKDPGTVKEIVELVQ